MASSVKDLEEEHSMIEGLRDEALLFVDQALVLEETHHIREVLPKVFLIIKHLIDNFNDNFCLS